jgi:hypothetical protein
VASIGGILGSLIMHKYFRYEEGIIHKTYSKEASESQKERVKSYLNVRKKTFFINTESKFDVFTICRGMLCGVVAVSINPAGYWPGAALFTGIIGGVLYVYSLSVTTSAGIDDSLHISHVHGLMSLISLFSICFFHKSEGFFFRDIYTEFSAPEGVGSEIDMDQVAPIILVLGSNSLSTFAVTVITSIVAGISFTFVFMPMMTFKRLHDRVQDIIGADIYSLFVHQDRILKNYICGIINEFYPSESGHAGYQVMHQK